MPPPHASNLAYYTPKTRALLRSKSHSNVVKLAKHSDFFDLSYERSGKKVEAKKYYTSHAAHWVIKFRRLPVPYGSMGCRVFKEKVQN